MERPTFVRAPVISVAVSPLPPMYTWPAFVKRAVLSVCVVLCVIAYIAMALGVIGLATVVLGLV
jgi:hypothetical protein